jgi:hypothetical protein
MDSEFPTWSEPLKVDALFYEGKDSDGQDTWFRLTPQGRWDTLDGFDENFYYSLVLHIGDNFGVLDNGKIYSIGAVFKDMTAESGFLGDLALKGALTIQERGTITVEGSNAKWGKAGLEIGSGQVGCWRIEDGEKQLDYG